MGENTNLETVGDIQRTDAVALYLDMVKRSLTDSVYWDDPLATYRFCRLNDSAASWKRYSLTLLQWLLNRYKIRLVRPYFVPCLGDYSHFSKEELANRRLLGIIGLFEPIQ